MKRALITTAFLSVFVIASIAGAGTRNESFSFKWDGEWVSGSFGPSQSCGSRCSEYQIFKGPYWHISGLVFYISSSAPGYYSDPNWTVDFKYRTSNNPGWGSAPSQHCKLAKPAGIKSNGRYLYKCSHKSGYLVQGNKTTDMDIRVHYTYKNSDGSKGSSYERRYTSPDKANW